MAVKMSEIKRLSAEYDRFKTNALASAINQLIEENGLMSRRDVNNINV